MSRKNLSLAIALLLLGTSASSAAPQSSSAQPADSAPAPRAAQEVTPERPIYGPIMASDFETRAEIKRLYRAARALETQTMDELAALNVELQNESDTDFRREIAAQILAAKKNLELGNMELQLEIAMLNGDERRVAEYSLAIDQVKNPDKYRPTPAELPVRELPRR